MPFPWIAFISFCILGSVGYTAAIKAANGHINPFVFTCILAVVALIGHTTCLATYKYVFRENVAFEIDRFGIVMAIVAGLSVVVIDLCYFFAIKHGGVSLSNTVWSVTSLVIIVALGLFVFKEPLAASKIAGIVLGVFSLYLLSRS